MKGNRALLRARGFSLIETLVTIVIVAIGLLGIAGLQARLQLSEMDAYQRTQALLLIQDIADRMSANRAQAGSYLTTAGPVGTGHDTSAGCSGKTGYERDLCEWSESLKGAAEQSAGGLSVGAMIGARGCVETTATNEYRITVAWQGLAPISAPTVSCGAGQYDGAEDSPCANDLCRRVVTTVIGFGELN